MNNCCSVATMKECSICKLFDESAASTIRGMRSAMDCADPRQAIKNCGLPRYHQRLFKLPNLFNKTAASTTGRILRYAMTVCHLAAYRQKVSGLQFITNFDKKLREWCLARANSNSVWEFRTLERSGIQSLAFPSREQLKRDSRGICFIQSATICSYDHKRNDWSSTIEYQFRIECNLLYERNRILGIGFWALAFSTFAREDWLEGPQEPCSFEWPNSTRVISSVTWHEKIHERKTFAASKQHNGDGNRVSNQCTLYSAQNTNHEKVFLISKHLFNKWLKLVYISLCSKF